LVTVDPAEFLALSAIVVALLAEMAGDMERSVGEDWIKNIGTGSAEYIQSIVFKTTGMERYRAAALKHIDRILASISFE
jgi:hypothetical protein